MLRQVGGHTAGQMTSPEGMELDGVLSSLMPFQYLKNGKRSYHPLCLFICSHFNFTLLFGASSIRLFYISLKQVPVSIADLGGTEIDLRFASSKEGRLFVIVAPVLRFADSKFFKIPLVALALQLLPLDLDDVMGYLNGFKVTDAC